MLGPDYLLALSEGAEEIASDLHTEIVRRVIRRIMIRLQRGDEYILTPLDKWQLEVLAESGELLEDIQAEIARLTPYQREEIARAFREAGVESLRYDHTVYEAAGLSPAPLAQSPYLMRLLERGYAATLGEWANYTRTTAQSAQQFFIRECDRAYSLVTSGAVSYSQACTEAVERIAGEGVVVTYPSGHRDTIETATQRAVRTGVGQSCMDITLARMDEMEWDIVLTSAHLGARTGDGGDDYTNHAWWQGRFFSRSGLDARFPPFAVCGPGTIQGVGGINCRHSVGPGDGENNPFERFDSEENKKAYELSQRQRLLERRIRKTKREVMGLKEAVDNADNATRPELEAAYQKKAALLQKQNKAYNDFCAENGLKRVDERLAVAGWNRNQAAGATAAARKAVATPIDSGIIAAEKAEEVAAVHSVGKIDIEKYSGISDRITTDEVVITEERIGHIKERHPDDFERYAGCLKEIVENPDYILEANKPNTASLLKEFTENDEHFQLILRLAVEGDKEGYKNSVITFLKIEAKRYNRYLRTKKIIYKRE